MLHSVAREMVFRPSIRPITPLPLNVRSAGRVTLRPGQEDPPKAKWFIELFWTVSGAGAFQTENSSFAAHEGDVFFYLPGDVHRLKADSAGWSYYWLTIDNPEAPQWLELLGLIERSIHSGPCPENTFAHLFAALRNPTPQGERQASLHAYAIMLEASSANAVNKSGGTLAARARKRMEACFLDARFGVDTLAAELGAHRSTLFRQFREAYGLAPSTFISNLRVQYAISLLADSTCSIDEVSARSGFSDANYFARCIRKSTGLSPRAVRTATLG